MTRILVTGATGNVGRLVVDELLALGADDVRALTLDPEKAALPAGVDVVGGNLGRPSTLGAVFEGVDRMYLAPLVKTAGEVCRLAAAAGVRRIVDLAGAKGGHWQPIEDAVEACGVPFVHLEPGEFMANAAMWAPQIRAGDVVRDGMGEAATTPIALADIASVAAHCLLEDGHEGRSYELSGPESLTRKRRVELIGAALGRRLSYVDLPRDEFVAQLALTMGDFARWYADGMEALIDHPQQPVPLPTGRPGTTFAAWACDNVAVFQ